MRLPTQAELIKFSAVATAIPRWVVALMASEGLRIPDQWKPVWVIFSVVAAAGMAIVEGVAFAYVFNAWKRERRPYAATRIFLLALVSAVLFVALLSPSIVASVRGVTLGDVLGGWSIWLWGISVAASTIAIVASVGYAERAQATQSDKPVNVAEAVPAVAMAMPVASRGTFEQYLAEIETRNGKPMSAKEIMDVFGVPTRTAYNWLEKQKMNGNGHKVGESN